MKRSERRFRERKRHKEFWEVKEDDEVESYLNSFSTLSPKSSASSGLIPTTSDISSSCLKPNLLPEEILYGNPPTGAGLFAASSLNSKILYWHPSCGNLESPGGI